MTKSEQKLLDHAKRCFDDQPFSPTQIGMALGHEQVAAASRVAPLLRSLVSAGVLEREQTGPRRVVYRLR